MLRKKEGGKKADEGEEALFLVSHEELIDLVRR